MAVYERIYKPYGGDLTTGRSRFLILPRYAMKDIFSSRLFTAFFFASLLWPLVCGILIYLKHNTEALAMLDLRLQDLLRIDAGFFFNWVLTPLGWLAFVVAVVAGPALVAPDLRNNGMPLYLSRPFSRTEYVLGKLSVLLLLMSAITWLPALVLWAFQAYLGGGDWLADNFWVGPALVLSLLTWMLVLSFLALALSALVKWKMLARVLFLGLYFIATGMGATMAAIYGTRWARLIQPGELRDAVWRGFFRLPADSAELPALAAAAVLAAVVAVCILLLSRKVRAYEVVSS